ncbi:hypothetical protein DUNSADRAFT_14299 [Dunaliella salina]|uniref:Uncharacterized protein n=1 Tax=Dunaliella salina TaxID=3046 RepID=A0ABQ7H2T4_DUNSA|nr:hypothetical protein DUNSADRAFT_14299 [Dunaliella salina]|eukprot:KAF5841123.1 hypothetical protein DUNSADRAFT_14299 [Dunaliella salina]
MLCKKGRLLPTQTCLKSTCFSLRRRMAPAVKGLVQVANAHELDSSFSGLRDENGQMTVAGFGSLLSERSARTTFPELQNFRLGKIAGWRRVFAHTADIFYKRGIARPETKEVGSLSLEPGSPEQEVVVSLFEVACTPESVQLFIAREHEFKFVSVDVQTLEGQATGRRAVICAAWDDEHYKATRCPPEEWHNRWSVHGVQQVWGVPGILPCRVYLRHCVLAAKSMGPLCENSFLDSTFLSDRVTTVRQHLKANPTIMDELPPPELIGRYSG